MRHVRRATRAVTQPHLQAWQFLPGMLPGVLTGTEARNDATKAGTRNVVAVGHAVGASRARPVLLRRAPQRRRH